MNRTMSMLGSVKDVVVGRAIRLMSDPRLTRIASDPRVMSAAMRALSLGGSVKTEIGKATRVAASVFGIATEDEISALRSTVQTLEDTVAMLEARGSTSGTTSGQMSAQTPGGPRSDHTTPAG